MAVNILPDITFVIQTTFGFIPAKYVGLYSDISKINSFSLGGNVIYYNIYASIQEIISPGNKILPI